MPMPNHWNIHFNYVLIRLLAVLGVLLLIETIFKNYFGDSDINTISFSTSAGARRPLPHEDGSTLISPNTPNGSTASGSPYSDGSALESKAIIAPILKGDHVEWIYDMFPDWEKYIFVVNDPSANLTVVENKGHEAGVYLTFIIHHYYSLPDYMVFIHGKRYEWHSDDPMYDTAPTIRNLNLAYVDEVGYTSLRCAWKPGCPVFVHPDINAKDTETTMLSLYASIFSEWFPDIPTPKDVGSPCCAQFALSKAQVLKRPVNDYEKYRQWLFTVDASSQRTGFVMEYMWHVIFGKPVLNCGISAKDCYCKKFGMCTLECPNEGKCEGTYWIPPGYELGLAQLPQGWPERGQGDGWPTEGWEKEFRPGEPGS